MRPQKQITFITLFYVDLILLEVVSLRVLRSKKSQDVNVDVSNRAWNMPSQD